LGDIMAWEEIRVDIRIRDEGILGMIGDQKQRKKEHDRFEATMPAYEVDMQKSLIAWG
jgi:hypothetical protein